MSGVALHWRSITPSTSPRFLVRGTDLSVALFGRCSRYAVYEVRCYNAEGNADREYVIRDAEALSGEDLRNGKRALIVERTRDYDELLRAVEKANLYAEVIDRAYAED